MDLASGLINNISTSARLDLSQMISIANSSYWTGWYAVAIEWLEAAKSLDKETIDDEIEEFLIEVREAHDSVWEAPAADGVLPNEMIFVSRIYAEDGLVKSAKQLREEEKIFFSTEIEQDLTHGGYLHDFYSLCRGEEIPTVNSESNMQCFEMKQTDPYLSLSPPKVEVVSNQPNIVLFHNIVTEKEITFIKNLKPHFMKVSE